MIWSDNLDNIIPICRDFEDKLIKLVWRARPALSSSASAITAGSLGSVLPSSAPSYQNLTEKIGIVDVRAVEAAEKEQEAKEVRAKANKGFNWFGWTTSKGKKGLSSGDRTEKLGDAEADGPESRPIRLFAPIYGGLGAGLSLFFVGSGVNILVREWMLDGSLTRFALLATAPFLFCVSLVRTPALLTSRFLNCFLLVLLVAGHYQFVFRYWSCCTIPRE